VRHRARSRARPRVIRTPSRPLPSRSRRAAARACVPAPACCRLAAASGGRRTSPVCRLLPLPTPGRGPLVEAAPALLRQARPSALLAVEAAPALLRQARPSTLLAAPARGPLLCSPPQARPGPPLCSPPLLCPLLCSQRSCSALFFLLEQRRAPSPPLVLFAL